ncbi:MAG: hypothetical protein OSB55_02040 [Verrucomicrobiota bacterium]|nr:hypothetical protein [Verrucomicrobiota bacterium]
MAVVNSIPQQPPTLGQAAGQNKLNKSIESLFAGRYKPAFTEMFAGATKPKWSSPMTLRKSAQAFMTG